MATRSMGTALMMQQPLDAQMYWRGGLVCSSLLQHNNELPFGVACDKEFRPLMASCDKTL